MSCQTKILTDDKYTARDKHQAQIQHNFDRAAKSYDDFSALQTCVFAQLLELTFPYIARSVKTIADFGCGTGAGLQTLSNTFLDAQLFGVDLSTKLLNVAAEKVYPNQPTLLAMDFDQPCFRSDLFQLILANMALHWSYDLEQCLITLNKLLQAGGILAFSLPIKGTFKELKQDFQHVFIDLLRLQQYCRGLELMRLETVEHTISFSDYFQALRSLKKVGAQSPCANRQASGLKTKRTLRDYFEPDAPPALTYRLALCVLRSKTNETF